MFILGEQRTAHGPEAFRRYERYIEAERHRFPAHVLELATSSWYFDFNDHRCPHDAWLQGVSIREVGRGERLEDRSVSMSVDLLGAYHDLVLTFTYTNVRRYRFDGSDVSEGHEDWLYDEFRVSEAGTVVHEIEWYGTEDSAHWVIEADDIRMEWRGLSRGA